jgi:putative flippase GtrA
MQKPITLDDSKMKELIFKKAVKFLNFSFVGTTTFAMQLFLTLLFTEMAHITYYISHAIALILAWLSNFTFNMKLTFNVKGMLRRRMGKYLLVAIGISSVNWLFVIFTVEIIHIHYFISIILVTAILSLLNFASQELWVFSKEKLVTTRPQRSEQK